MKISRISIYCILYTVLSVLPLQAQRFVPKGGERLVGNVRGGSPSGMYSLPTVSDGEPIALCTGNDFTYNGAGVFDGEFYYATSWSEMWGTYFVYHYFFNPETWQERGYYYGSVATIATDMDYNPSDKRIYGCFNNDSADGYVFGYITTDGVYWDRTAVCNLGAAWVGFACTKDGLMYAVTAKGMLIEVYTDGSFREVGSTGLTPHYVGSAAISEETGILYLNLVDDSQKSSLYAINVATAHATKVYDVGKGKTVYGMYVPSPLAANGAPAQPQNFSVTFQNGSLAGTATFLTPAECYDGSTLTGWIDYEITLNGSNTAFASGSVEAGSTAAIELNIPSAGQYAFSLKLKNSVGYSPETTFETWVGLDAPSAPLMATFVYDESAEQALVTWKCPVSSAHGGYVDQSAVTYRVVRQPDGTQVADGITETSFSERLPLPETLTAVYYSIQAVHAGQHSEPTLTNEVSLGYITPPYVETFDSEEALKGWVLLNLNDTNDAYGWSYINHDTNGSCLMCMYSKNGENNDWAISPGLNLKAGVKYDVSIDLMGYKQYPNVFRLCMGQSQSAGDMTHVLIDRTERAGNEWETYRTTFTPDEDGRYFLGINDVSAYNQYTLYLDNVRVGAKGETVTIGKPVAPGNLTVCETVAGTVHLQWDTPTCDIEGNEMPPELVTYNVTMTRGGVEKTIATGLTDTEFMYKVCEPEDEQTYVYFKVSGQTARGEGKASSTMSTPVGRAITMTFSESFENGAPRYRYSTQSDGNSSWETGDASGINVSPQDGDNGLLRYSGIGSSYGDFIMPKIRVADPSPVLTFWTRASSASADAAIQVIAIVGVQAKVLATFDVDYTEWTEQTVDLGELVGVDVHFIIHATSSKSAYVYFDNFHVKAAVDDNLAAYSVSAPTAVHPDQEFEVSYIIENIGLRAVSGYTIKLLRDGKTESSVTGATLNAGRKLKGTFTTSLNSSANPNTKYGIEICHDADKFDADNRTSESDMATVLLATNALPVATNLVCEQTQDGFVLSWDAPEQTTVVNTVTDSFEDYAASAYSHIGDWTLIDADGNRAGSLSGITLGVEGKKISFFVLDKAQNSKYPSANSGTKMMSTIFNVSGANDDWLVTPRLCGMQQYISFFACSYNDGYPETFEMLYSTSDDPEDTSAYTLIRRVEKASQEWTEFGCQLPDGATYFAIRCISEEKFFLLVDDVTFIPAKGEDITITLLGYNVYRNGVRLNNHPITECRYATDEIDGTYVVTVVYAEGESARSNLVELPTDGVEAIGAFGYKPKTAYDLSGRRTINGNVKIENRKVIIWK